MSNEYYDHGTFPAPNTKISSAGMRAELDNIEAGFNKLPTLAGNQNKVVRVKADASGLEAVPAADVNVVTSVAGKTGAVVLAKADVGLGNVDNTSDADKPVSTATQTALNSKSNTGHGHAISDVTGLQTALDGKQETLVSGTNIKTVGGQALPGSGDVTFKTINGESVVGNGNIAISSGLSAASTVEAQDGTSNTVAITPLRLREGLNAGGAAPIYACRAWVNFNGTGTVAIRASGNVSSITDNGTGNYTVNFTNAMPDLNYATIGNSWYNGVASSLFAITATPSSASSKTISTQNAAGTGAVDVDHCCVGFFR